MVNAENYSKIVGAFSTMGAAVVTNGTIDNKVTAEVGNSSINANGKVSVYVEDNHKADETIVAAAGSTGLAVGVNGKSTSVNSGLADIKADTLDKTVSAKDLVVTGSDKSSNENSTSDSDKLTGEYGDKHFINEKDVNKLLEGVQTYSQTTKGNITSTLTKRYTATGKKIAISLTENNNLGVTSGSDNAGIVGIGVGSNSVKTRCANVSKVVGSTFNANDIDITAASGKQSGSDYGIQAKVYNATVAPVGVSGDYSNVEMNGTGEILISNSKISAANKLNMSATDKGMSKSYVGYTGVFSYLHNNR